MSVYTAEHVEERAKFLDREQRHETADMLRDLARRIRQDTSQDHASVDVEIRKGPRILGSCNIIVMPFAGWAPGDRARVIKTAEAT